MYKYNPFIMQNIRANTLIIGANNNPINKKSALKCRFFRLIIKKQHYYLLIYRKTIMFARKIPRYLRSNGIF